MREVLQDAWNARRFYLSFRIHPFNAVLDAALSGCLKSGIRDLSSTEYYISVEFNNGKKGHLWNANFPYSWLSRGSIDSYMWRESMPSRRTMARFQKEMQNFLIRKWTAPETAEASHG